MDVEAIAFKLQAMEVENRSLNGQNSRLMDQLFKQKKENQRIKQVEERLRDQEKLVNNLERANQLLLDRLKKSNSSNYHMDSTGYRQGLIAQVEEGESEVRDLEDLDITKVSEYHEQVLGGFFQPQGKAIGRR
jgi:hypothetical protein